MTMPAVLAAAATLSAEAVARELTQDERERIAHLVALELRDAETALFEWPDVDIPEAGTEFVDYCGWVNGRNAYGAYAGFVSFSVWLLVQEGTIIDMQIPAGPGSGGVPSLDALCVESGYGRS
ncbi:hypothetical protein SAMN05443573_13031 [Celeribacter indicus]|uniref:Uncharacterized protein n=2 Tax=Celeribacter indicus TaxID=1208324 RepID=A0A0B5DVK5_9RHOB|nr:hypothetical protein P73_0076 [Celeribacter indicus]SDX47061.1 hypothetical protein SAMN05443573_13031 [Celeribacter indicus]